MIIDLIKDSTESQIAVFIYLIQTDERAIAALRALLSPPTVIASWPILVRIRRESVKSEPATAYTEGTG